MVLASAVVLAWDFPARWAMAWVAPYLHGMQLQQVHGSLWHGRADRAALPDGREMGRASWQVSRRVLYADVPIQVQLQGPQLAFSADVRMLSRGQTRWDNVKLRTDLAAWPDASMDLDGEWRMTAHHVLMQDGWPLQLDLVASWQDAAVRTPLGPVALGALELIASARDGVIDVRVHDVEGGPLQVKGHLMVSPLGWRIDAQVRQRQANPARERWLGALGVRDAAGVVHVERHGGFAFMPAVLPASAASAWPPRPSRPGRT
ncbi:MAG: type II secretion system protein N [Rhodanobacter sp.]